MDEKDPELVSSKLSWPEEGPKKCQYKSTCRERVQTGDTFPMLTQGDCLIGTLLLFPITGTSRMTAEL